ncbi:DUF1761 domain-containing protein [Candidatus Micrarchaeota archaeon]|nr:DUF1761 domain-containing protein [Candidatus Micrarchaeota archaeon]
MAMPVASVNLVAVVLAAAASFVIGMLWYSPSLFGKTWMKEAGLTEKEMRKHKKGMAQKFGIAFLGGLAMAYVLAHFIAYATEGYPTLGDGLLAAFWAWLGFVVPVTSGMVLWEGKSLKFYAINVGELLVSMLAMGALLAAWA